MIDLSDTTIRVNDSKLNITDLTVEVTKVKGGYALDVTIHLHYAGDDFKQKPTQFLSMTASEVWTGKNAKKKAKRMAKKFNRWVAEGAADAKTLAEQNEKDAA